MQQWNNNQQRQYCALQQHARDKKYRASELPKRVFIFRYHWLADYSVTKPPT
jgi:hypothetical protein